MPRYLRRVEEPLTFNDGDVLLDGGEPSVRGEDALHTTAIIEAMDRSIWSGVPETPRQRLTVWVPFSYPIACWRICVRHCGNSYS